MMVRCGSFGSLKLAILASLSVVSVLFSPVRADDLSAEPIPVDVALVLAVDVSRSMSPEELLIQRRGYAAAIADPAVIKAIQFGAHGRIALTFFEWAGSGHAREIIGWSLIETAGDAQAFADRLGSGRSVAASRTSISGAIRHGSGLLDALPFQADRRVIDISGDGPNNEGVPVTLARDEAIKAGIAINGLPLLTSDGFYSSFSIPELDAYYRACVVGGPASFVVPVTDWEQFPEAVRRKLVLEIGGLMPDARSEGRPVMTVQYTARPAYDCMIGEKIWQQRRQQFFLDP
ncbi:DUF1194 domain-containing protein [Roseibium limicola]|nr:DUF1194 domain-containing protein [Roseibium limicola]